MIRGDRPGEGVRLGAVSYLNALPLIHGLDREPGIHLEAWPPSLIAARLADGRLDVGLVPVVELLRQPGWRPVSDAGIASLGAVQSVILVLRRAPAQVRTLSLDPHSRTSQILARICLRELYGVVPECRERPPHGPVASVTADAALVIGDEALRLQLASVPHLDLGAAWFALTGQPFVFAAWAARSAAIAASPGLSEALESARDRGRQACDRIAREAAAAAGVPEPALRVYLRRRIRYRLGTAEAAGLRCFLELARPLVGGRSPVESTVACWTSGSSERTPRR